MVKPKQKASIDINAIRAICEGYIDEILGKSWRLDKWEAHIFETTLEAVYGECIWQWMNENQKEEGE